jgi:hypothetical protein
LTDRLDQQYLLAAGVMGLLYVVVTPPFQVPDEPANFVLGHPFLFTRMVIANRWGILSFMSAAS